MSSVTERHRAAGLWEIAFRDLPQEYVDQLDELGHIAITVAREDGPLGDHLLNSARYVGVVRFRRKSGGGDYDFQLRGAGLAWWLGTEDRSGDVIETPLAFSAADFDDVVRALIPDSLTEGTLISTGLPTFTHTFTYVSRREALDYACDTVGAEWRVRGGGLVDAGPRQDLYGDPKAVIVRRVADAGEDMELRAYPGPAQSDRDIEDYTTRVVVLGRVEESTVVSGAAELPEAQIPYRDLFGNPVKMTRLVNESSTEGQNATARAQAQLAEQSQPATAVTLDTGNYDMRGTIEVGADVWVYDPEAGLEDPTNEITFRGQRLNPRREQVRAMTWPITAQMGVYYRSRDGEWLDVSRWVDPVDGQTTIEVGKQPGDLSYTAGSSSPVGRVPEPDTSVPNAPVFQTTFPAATTQTDAGLTRVQLNARWFAVTENTDGSPFVDGSHYELRYRDLGTLDPGDTSGNWATIYAPVDSPSVIVPDLNPGTSYQFQVRALDSASPPNASAWSAPKTVATPYDEVPPSTPAAPLVAGSPISIQVRHFLGSDQGGTYNLESDIRVLQVHASTAGAGFTPDDTTKLGELRATYAMLLAQVPAIGTFPVPTTDQLWVKVIAVDEFGNASPPSAGAAVTAQLITDQYVDQLSATKVVAGEFAATYAVTGLMIAGNAAGSRWESGTRGSLTGGRTYRPSNTLAVSLDAGTGDLTTYRPDGTTRTFRVEASTGNVYLYRSDGTTPTLTLTASTGMLDVNGRISAGAGVGVGRTIVVDPTGDGTTPAVNLYPNATAQRVRWRALEDSNPGNGASTPMFQINTLTAAGVEEGAAIETWDQGVWIGTKESGDWAGGAVKLYHPDYPGNAGAFLAYQDDSTGVDAFVSVAENGSITLQADNGQSVTVTSESGFNVTAPGQVVMSTDGQVILEGGGDQRLLMQSNGQITTLRANSNNRVTMDTVAGTQVLSGGTVKSFVIDHPTEPDRWLVHGCLEGPEAAVFYRGVAVIEDHLARVELPPYFVAATRAGTETVHLTPELSVLGGLPAVATASPTAVQDGRFSIICPAADGTRVHWVVYATRADVPELDVEPLRNDVVVHGDGPYRHLTPR